MLIFHKKKKNKGIVWSFNHSNRECRWKIWECKDKRS